MEIDKNKWEFHSYQEFSKKVDIEKIDTSLFECNSEWPNAMYAIHKGDFHVDGSFDINKFFQTLNNDLSQSISDFDFVYIVWIQGNMVVKNSMYTEDEEDMTTSFVVEGDLSSKSVVVGGTRLQVLGNLKTDTVFYLTGAEACIIYKEPFNGKLFYNFTMALGTKTLLRDNADSLVEINETNHNLLIDSLDMDILEKIDEEDDESEFNEDEFVVDEEAAVSFLIAGKSLFRK